MKARHIQILAVIISIVSSSCTILKDTSVDPISFLGDKKNSTDIYSYKTKDKIYSPFNFRIESPDKLILFDFEGYSRYKFLECQFYNDTIFGKGVVCMLMRQDDRLEIYHTDGVNMKQQLYYFDSGQNNIPVNTFKPEYSFDYIEGNLDFSIKFKDKFDNEISAALSGYYPDHLNFLVPVGLINHHYSEYVFFPLFYCRKINFLNTGEGVASVSINDTTLEIKKIPGLVNWKRLYFARWSFDPIFVLWNKNFNGEIVGLKDDHSNKSQPLSYKVVKNNTYIEIERIIYSESGHIAVMNFSPPLPELLCIKENISLEGKFTIDIDEKEGIIGGEYFINRNGKIVELKLQPTKGWQPLPGKSWVNNHFLNVRMEETEKGNVLVDSKWGVNE